MFGMGLRLTLSLQLMCKVCRCGLDHTEQKDAVFFLGDKTYRINLEKWLRMRQRFLDGIPFDPLMICPACGTDRHAYLERNYRARAHRYIRKYLQQVKEEEQIALL